MIDPQETLVTVFGGSGFIGRYVCEYLLGSGVRVLVAGRDPRDAFFIQPLSPVGRFGAVKVDLTDRPSIDRAVDKADCVINLTGSFAQMKLVHDAGAQAIAEAARAADARSLIHVSAIGADPASESVYGRTKGQGECAVRKAFPTATIIRPSLVFGPEDQLTNRFAAMARFPLVPVLAPKTKFQPVYVRDLARAIVRAALDPKRFGGKLYEIGGPQVLSMLELNQTVAKLAGKHPQFLELPDLAGTVMSTFGFLPGAPLTRDQWLMLQQDNVVSPGAEGLAAFGIEPTPLGAVAGEWLGRYRGGSRFQGRRPGPSAAA